VARGKRDPLQAAFGRAVRRAREVRKISQEKLAELSDINRTYMGDVERGERNLALKNMSKIASALGMRLSQLIRAMEEELKKPLHRPSARGHPTS
jgi:transcriptional regulator with XRE-family HTH domain